MAAAKIAADAMSLTANCACLAGPEDETGPEAANVDTGCPHLLGKNHPIEIGRSARKFAAD